MKNVFAIQDSDNVLYPTCFTNVKMIWEEIVKLNKSEDVEPVFLPETSSDEIGLKYNKKKLTYTKMIAIFKRFPQVSKLVTFNIQPMERFGRVNVKILTIRELVVKSKNKEVKIKKTRKKSIHPEQNKLNKGDWEKHQKEVMFS